MARGLTTRAKITRLHNQGFSDRQIADATGFSKSSVGRIRRGQQSGEKIAPAVNEFFKLGKRAKESVIGGSIPLPSAKPATAVRMKRKIVERPVSPLKRARGKLSQYDGDTKVVVQMTSKETGKSRTLFAHGGIEASDLRGYSGGLGAAIAAQVDSQYGEDEDPIDYDDYDMWDIDIDEY